MRPSLAHIKRTLFFPLTSQLLLFLKEVRLNCLVMPIKNINFKGGEFFPLQIVGLGYFERNSLIKVT